jgi:hypothetical protein
MIIFWIILPELDVFCEKNNKHLEILNLDKYIPKVLNYYYEGIY